MNCRIPQDPGLGDCCCNCANQTTITKHPWNKTFGKGSISDVMGYGCSCPDLKIEGYPSIVFFDTKHGNCEMHTPIK